MKINPQFCFWLFFVSMSVIMFSCTTPKDPLKTSYPDHVGDIAVDQTIDDPDFKVCDEGAIYQYYNFGKGLQYKGEKPKISEKFKSFSAATETHSGYITIRFVVNCKGETGRFRIQQMDDDYQEMKFLPETVDQLLKLTQQLDGWVIGEDGVARDYYQYLTFKIQQGQLIEIMP